MQGGGKMTLIQKLENLLTSMSIQFESINNQVFVTVSDSRQFCIYERVVPVNTVENDVRALFIAMIHTAGKAQYIEHTTYAFAPETCANHIREYMT